MNVGCHPGPLDGQRKRNKAIKGGEADLANRGVLEKDHRRIYMCLFKRLK